MTLRRTSLFAVFTLACAPLFAQEDAAMPANQQVAGLSQAQWSRAWWQWAASFEGSESPVADQSGELCDRKQSGPVWFLAGTYGTHRTSRACRMPRGKFLFFPLINYVVFPRDARSLGCSAVTVEAAAMTDRVSNLIVDLDGVRIERLASYRQATRECFDLGARGPTGVPLYPAAANGYYVMLRPLSPGRHVLNFGGVLPRMAQAVTYTLEVE
jgi:hypothetical protein